MVRTIQKTRDCISDRIGALYKIRSPQGYCQFVMYSSVSRFIRPIPPHIHEYALVDGHERARPELVACSKQRTNIVIAYDAPIPRPERAF
jgi:hypothetical protein